LTTLPLDVHIIAMRGHMLKRKNREVTVKHVLGALLGAATLLGSAPSIAQTTLTIATGEQLRHDPHAGVDERVHRQESRRDGVKWVTLEENVLRQRVTTDIATQGRSVRCAHHRHYEVPIWARRTGSFRSTISGRLRRQGSASQDQRCGVVSGKLYAAPFLWRKFD